MSSRKTYSLSLSDEAIEDFRDILSYTMQMWGERQVEEYATILHKALTDIEQDPLVGKGDLPPYHHVRAGKHVVFYRLTEDKVQVSRILHSAMDFVRHLEP
ncbi:MAG: type II toxin-antitoxin system RelE/ParE family toxin [Nitrospira sp.]|nr:type II toxin-antitoxin system RelE/ParE family toxin [Nitrospira sp.]